jgi:serine O-acetyltransferase
VENPTLERLEALSQRVEFLEKLLDDRFLKERA